MYHPVGRLVGHTADVLKACYADVTSASVLSCSIDSTIKLWDTSTESVSTTKLANKGSISDFCIAGNHVFTSGDEGINHWDLRSRETHPVLFGVYVNVVISSDNRTLVTSSETGDLHLVDLIAGKTLLRVRAHGKRISNLHLSSDNSTVLSTSLDGTIKTWSAISGDPINSFTSQSQSRCLHGCFLGSNEIAGLFGDDVLRIWDIENRSEVCRSMRGLNVGNSIKNFCEADGDYLVIPGATGTLQFFKDGILSRTSPRVHIDDISFVSASGDRLLSSGYGVDSSIVMWKRHESLVEPRITFNEVYPQIVGL